MNDTTRTAAVALLVVAAVAVAAASLDATAVPERGGPERPTGGNGSGPASLLPPPPEPATLPGEPVHVPYVSEVLSVLAVPETPQALGPGEGILFGEAGGGGEASAPRPGPPPTVLLVLAGLVAAGAAVALFRPTGDDGTAAEAAADDGDADRAAIGRAAARGADRLEAEADVDNEVYRTWREMTDLLDVDEPETSTPGEFAAAAVEAGLGREDVDELTRLFEDVRYGGADPSGDHERRAVAVFRRIEERYAEEGP